MLDLINIQTEVKQIINEAMYQNYKYNREYAPDISLESWKLVFNNVEDMERRYIAENN